MKKGDTVLCTPLPGWNLKTSEPLPVEIQDVHPMRDGAPAYRVSVPRPATNGHTFSLCWVHEKHLSPMEASQ